MRHILDEKTLMIYETDKTTPANPLVRDSVLIREALAWAKTAKADTQPGRYDLRGDDLYALVQVRNGLPREERRAVEAHREYADLQYCLEGGEFIDWYPLEALTPSTEYDPEKDFQLYQRPAMAPLALPMRPGSWVLLLPGDGHAPMVTDGEHASTRMVVFKIRLSAL